MTAYTNPLHRYPSYEAFGSHVPVATDERKSIVNSMDSFAPVSSRRQDVNFFILFIFILELLVLVFVSVLAYFLRATDVFPVRHLNFSCSDTSLGYSPEVGESTYVSFQYYADIPYAVVFSLCFALPPFLIIISEIAVFAFTDQPQKTVRAVCRPCKLPQAFRRMVRFIGTFLFGLLVTMIFTDVTKIFVGRLRPTFLSTCNPDLSACVPGDQNDEDICKTDKNDLRQARLSFPSIHASTTAFTACYMAIYFHCLLRTPGVRVMRPFIALAFCMMALMMALARYGLHYSHWTDVVVGTALGVVFAVYISVFVLNNFHERLSSERLYTRLKYFLQQQRHLELTQLYKEGYMWYPDDESITVRGSSRLWMNHTGQGFINKDRLERQSYFGGYPGISIPRPHVHGDESTTEADTDAPPVPRRSTSDAKQQQQYHNTFQRDLSRTLDQYRRDINAPHYHHM